MKDSINTPGEDVPVIEFMTTYLIEMSVDFINFINYHITRIEYAPGQGLHFGSITDNSPKLPEWMIIGFLTEAHLDKFSKEVNDGDEISINNELRFLTHQEMRGRLKRYLDKVERQDRSRVGIVSVSGDKNIKRIGKINIRHILAKRDDFG